MTGAELLSAALLRQSVELPSPKGSEPSNPSVGNPLRDARGWIQVLLGLFPCLKPIRRQKVEQGMGAMFLMPKFMG